jgi:hypothetical protein
MNVISLTAPPPTAIASATAESPTSTATFTAATFSPTEAAALYRKRTANKGKEKQVAEDDPIERIGTFASNVVGVGFIGSNAHYPTPFI